LPAPTSTSQGLRAGARAITCAWISAAPFEDVEDARVAEDAADRVLDGIAVAAVDLQRVVGGGPGDLGGEQLGEAGLEVAAPLGVLLAGGEEGELARDLHLDRHPGELARDAGEGGQRLLELLALLGIGEAELERVAGHAHGPGRGLDARPLEGRHELLEALALDAAQEIVAGHPKAVEAERVFLHATVAEDLDLAAGEAVHREGVGRRCRGASRRAASRGPCSRPRSGGCGRARS
jgi:hypothetical protein